ncbi:hypothetical protein BDP27DRAFT_1408940 [Rhodocollybia butyracea]|uniref:Uncharacterized protein n=1 Tax=Rhodocollybia butyracea TaxID=206335 RepID=A0A9P5TX41_9AGAR|nr:hypothetical protein BDP27DRAFT_1408940 [Rhodocollybia butyracea]
MPSSNALGERARLIEFLPPTQESIFPFTKTTRRRNSKMQSSGHYKMKLQVRRVFNHIIYRDGQKLAAITLSDDEHIDKAIYAFQLKRSSTSSNHHSLPASSKFVHIPSNSSDKIQIDTTHLVSATPAATHNGAHATSSADAARGVEYLYQRSAGVVIEYPHFSDSLKPLLSITPGCQQFENDNYVQRILQIGQSYIDIPFSATDAIRDTHQSILDFRERAND